MNETTQVRENLMTDINYKPYCGAYICLYSMPRAKWNGKQFECTCGWTSEFPDDFIQRYKSKWELK